MESPEEFDCLDCGCRVYRFAGLAANDDHLCAECHWLRDVADPKERERLREILNGG